MFVFLFQVESYMSHDWPFMVITVRQLIYVRRRLGYPSFTKMISSSPACKVEYLKSLHREWQILAAISCVSHARECIPVHGYESCACYSLCHCWIIASQHGSYYIMDDEWGMKKRPKYEWPAEKQI